MELLAMLLIGVILGTVITRFITYRKAGYGYFTLVEEPDENGDCAIRIRIPHGQPLGKVNKIVLDRESNSHK